MKKQEKKSKKLLWAILAILLVIGATVAALVLSGVFGGSGEPEATEPPAQAEDSKLYWNVARTRYVAKGIQGTSSRTPASDGYFYIKMAVDGEQVDIKVADMRVVNLIDFQEIMGLTFDETGVCVGVKSVEETTGGRVLCKRWAIETVTGDTLTCNTSEKLKGIHVDVPVGDYTRYWEVGDFEALVGIETVPASGDQACIIEDADGKVTDVFVFPFIAPGDVYWNIYRQYDSKLAVTTREPDMTGAYVYDFAVNGEVVTLKTKSKEVADLIDKHASQAMGFRFDEDGLIVEVLNAGNIVCGGGLTGNRAIVQSIDGDELVITYGGETIEGTISKECKIFDVTGTAAMMGMPIKELQVGDKVTLLRDRRDQYCVIFVTDHPVVDPIYWVSERNKVWDRTNWVTKRQPAADGYYYIKLAGYGGEIVGKTKDAELVNEIDSYVCWAVQMQGEEIVDVFEANTRYGGSAVMLFYKVQSIEGNQLTASDDKNTRTFEVAEDCEIYLVGDSETRKGIKTDAFQVGDTIYCFTNAKKQIVHAFVSNRPKTGKIYWNVTRFADSGNTTTTRIPDASGRYWFETVVDGQTQWLWTYDRSIATAYDKVISRARGLEVSASGEILKVVAPNAFKNYKDIEPYAGWSIIKSIDGGVYKSVNEAGTTNFQFTLAPGCKIYNVSGGYVKYRGEPTTIREGDSVVTMVNKAKQAVVVFVCGGRKFEFHTEKYSCDCAKNVVWTPWDGVSNLGTGHYYLTQDAVAPAGGYVINGKTVHLRLDGHTLTGDGRVFDIKGTGVLNICDHDTRGVIQGKAIADDSGGVIRLGATTARLGLYGVDVNVIGNESTVDNGGAISVSGFATMVDVNITGTDVNRKGGALAVMPAGHLRMYDCTVTGGSAKMEGGVVMVTGNALFDNVTVSGGSAPSGEDIAITAADKTVIVTGGSMGNATLNSGELQISGAPEATLQMMKDTVLDATGLTKDSKLTLAPAGFGVIVENLEAEAVTAITVTGEYEKVYDADAKTLSYVPEHYHCLCGTGGLDHTCQMVGYTELTLADFTNATATSKPISKSGSNFILAAGSYYLGEDITLSGQIILQGPTTDVDLCLNGHTLTGPATNRVFALNSGILKVTDCGTTGSIQGGKANGSVFLLQGDFGGIVHLYAGTVKGGTATGNGGTVLVTKGEFHMYGGTLVGCQTGQMGGTIYLSAGQTLDIQGGKITNGTATLAECIYVGSKTTLNISGSPEIGELYLASGVTMTQSVTENAKIGLYMEQPGVFAEGDATQAKGFMSHNEQFEIACTGTDLAMVYSGQTEDAGDLTMRYDDRLDIATLSGGTGTGCIVMDENVTSQDDHVLMASGGKLIAVGTGTAKVITGTKEYQVTVEKAPISLFMITGHSVGAGQEGNAAQSIALEPGTAYSTFRTTLTADGMGLGFGADARPDGIDAFGTGGGGTLGTGSAVAYQWNKLTGDKVWIINAAMGGSCLNEWQPGHESPRGQSYSHLYDKAVANFQAAQTILKREIAAGHYTMSEMAVFYYSAANFQGNLGGYADFTQESLEKDYKTLWGGLKQDLLTDMDGDGNAETVTAFGLVPLWPANGIGYYNTDKPANFYMAASSEYPDIYMACNYEKWCTEAGIAAFPDITYTTQDGNALAKPIAPTDAGGNGFLCPDNVHLTQVGYNAVGMEAAQNLYTQLNGGTAAASVTVYSASGAVVPDTLTLSVGQKLLVAPVTEPCNAGGLTFETTGNVKLTYPMQIEATALGSGTVTISQNGTVLWSVNVTVEESHSHCICGGNLSHTCTDTAMTYLTQADFDNADGSSLWIYRSGSNLTLAEGNYALAEDIVFAGQILIYDNVTLCLNDHSIASSNVRAFAVCGGTLNITDCGTKGTVKGSSTSTGGTMFIQGSKGAANGDPATVNIYAGTIEGGKATSATAGHGGNLYIVGGTLNMYGGKLIGGTAAGKGANVIVMEGQTANFYGGELTSGTAALGNCLYVARDATVTLDGDMKIPEIYLDDGKLTIGTLADGFTTALTCSSGGVFAEGVETDYAARFQGTGETVTYNAADKTLSYGTAQKHADHCLCGGTMSHTCTSVTWTALTQSDFDNATASSSPVKLSGSNYALVGGSYYLKQDITLTRQIIVTAKVDLCLNGKTLTGPTNNRVMAINEDGVNITDCGTTGNIIGGKASTGAGFYINMSSYLNLYNGTITGGTTTAGYGGAIAIYKGTMNMYGGKIIGGKASTVGGAILINSNCTLEVYGGTITAGTAGEGRGSCIYTAATGKIIVGGAPQIDEVHLQGGKLTVSTDKPLTADAKIGLTTSSTAGTVVVAENIGSDITGMLTNRKSGYDLVYDAIAKTLSFIKQ